MRKKQLSLLAAALLILLTACSGKAPDSPETAPVPESTQSAQPQTDDSQLSQGGQISGGSEQGNAASVPLDTELSGKTAREETQWFSFTTDETENATYRITQVNQTPETGNLSLSVYDAEENVLNRSTLNASQSGKAETLSLDLLPETTYYIKIWADKGDVIQYSLIIRSPDGQRPENNVAQPGPEPTDGLEISGAGNQADAHLLPLNAKLEGKVSRSLGQWYAFSTNSAENAAYKLTMVNMTPGTGRLCMHVYDMFGEAMNLSRLEAFQEGRAATLSLELPPNTTYYIYLWADEGDTIDYSLTICAPEDPGARN